MQTESILLEEPLQRTAATALSSRASLGQRAGFALLCLFIISPYANEFTMRVFHMKAYVSTVSWFVLPLLLLLSGNLFPVLRHPIGILWAIFLAWILLAAPFSAWRGGSLNLIVDYVPHGWIQLFYFAAFAISAQHLRRLMSFLIFSDILLLIDCAWGGSMATGRLEIPDSMFFRNANDLSLQLLVAIAQFFYLLYQQSLWKRALGAVCIGSALVFMFETGARGAFLTMLALGCVMLALSRRRIRLVLCAVPVSAAALLIVPSGAFHRVMLLSAQQDTTPAGAVDQAALGSQTQRLALLRQSVSFALQHPLLGVGPGQFAVAASQELALDGQIAPWLGTHNSYTEVASECGLPAFLLYSTVILLTVRSNWRIYKRSAHNEHSPVNAIALSLFASALAYAIDTMFFHIAYSSYLPAIGGMTIALRLHAQRQSSTACDIC